MDKNKAEALARLDAIEKEAQELRKIIDTPENITDRIKTLQDVVDYLGKDDIDVILLGNLIALKVTPHLLNYQKLVVITKALNERQTLDWDKESVAKYYNYWDMRGELRFGNSDYDYSDSFVPSQLCFKTRELAEYAAKQFICIYKNYMKR